MRDGRPLRSRFMRFRSVIVHLVVLAACSTDDPASSPPPDASAPNDSGSAVDTGAASNDASSAGDADAAVDATPSAYAASVLADSPVAYWRFGETSGTTARNAAPTGPAYDLTLSAGFTANDLGKPGLIANEPGDKAFFFTGGTFASVPFGASTPGLKATKAFTVEAWVRLATGPDASADTIFGTKDPNGTNGFLFFIQANGKFGLPCPTNGFYGGNTLTVPFDDQPHHVAVVWDGAGSTATFYLDGTTEQTAGVADASITYTSPNATVGAIPPGDASNFLGVLDEVAFYDKAVPVARLVAHRSAAQ